MVTVELSIGKDRVVTVTGEPQDIFAVVNGLKEQGYETHLRHEDKEVGQTCWIPITK